MTSPPGFYPEIKEPILPIGSIGLNALVSMNSCFYWYLISLFLFPLEFFLAGCDSIFICCCCWRATKGLLLRSACCWRFCNARAFMLFKLLKPRMPFIFWIPERAPRLPKLPKPLMPARFRLLMPKLFPRPSNYYCNWPPTCVAARAFRFWLAAHIWFKLFWAPNCGKLFWAKTPKLLILPRAPASPRLLNP